MSSKIERVEQSKSFEIDTNNKWLPIIKNLNPVNAISEAYAKTLAYRIEVKRLDTEMNRINKQAEVILETIDKSYKIKMEELSHRRIYLEKFFETVQSELTNKHIGVSTEFGPYCTLRNSVEYFVIINLRDNQSNLWKTDVFHRFFIAQNFCLFISFFLSIKTNIIKFC